MKAIAYATYELPFAISMWIFVFVVDKINIDITYCK